VTQLRLGLALRAGFHPAQNDKCGKQARITGVPTSRDERKDRKPMVSWAALLDEAVRKPGYIHEAYGAFTTTALGKQLVALFQCFERGLRPRPLVTFTKWKELGRHVKKGEKALPASDSLPPLPTNPSRASVT